MERDWFDMLNHSGSYKYPYRIQWDRLSGNVRVMADNSSDWVVSDCCVNAKYALYIGYQLLERGEKDGKTC
jgi:hypothetical protein